jgi:hypothetical protein
MEEANKAANDAMDGQEVKPPVVLPTIKGNYPIIDPFANPQYWNARTTQYQASMQAAATNSKIMNQKAVEAIDAEFQQTKAMMQAIGGVMQQGGEMMQSMGAKMAEAEQLEAATQRTECLNGAVGADETQFERNEEGRLVYTPVDSDGNRGEAVVLSQQEEQSFLAARQNQQNTINVGEQPGVERTTLGWTYNGQTYYSESAVRSAIAQQNGVNNQVTALNAQITAKNNQIESYREALSREDLSATERAAYQSRILVLGEEVADLTARQGQLARPSQGDTTEVGSVVGASGGSGASE